MSLTLRRADERGHARHGWLDSWHTFSFAEYYDPDHMGFRNLRVINEDRIAGGAGFGMHPHADMEILTYIIEGALTHRDSMGTGSTIRPGDVQRMSAGSGVRHSEMNGSETQPVHLLQIWIEPNAYGIAPEYGEKQFDATAKRDRLCLIASPDGADGSLAWHADARVFASILSTGKNLEYALANDRHAWIQLIRGVLMVNGERLNAGDAAAVSGETSLKLEAADEAEFLLFSLT